MIIVNASFSFTECDLKKSWPPWDINQCTQSYIEIFWCLPTPPTPHLQRKRRHRLCGSKRHGLQAVELLQRTQAAVQIVSNLPAPSNGGPIYRLLACQPCGPAGWLTLLLTKAGDVETNPGPTTLNKRVWICDICHKQKHVRKQISIRCNRIEHWVHLRCAGIRQAQYTDTWTCHLHSESRLTPHTDITPPHHSQPWSKPPSHSPQPKHRHMSNTPPVPTGLVKHPILSPTPPRAKHIHMSHTSPTPLTTLISSTSPLLDKTPEPHVPLIHALTATTPPRDPTPALPSPSHSHSIHTCNTNTSICITVPATTALTT